MTWTLHLGDCLEYLRGTDRTKIGCIITDPPYGISHPCNFASRGRGKLAQCNDYPDVHDDDKPFDPSPILALDVPTVLWGANHFADKLPPSGGWLVWDKLRPDDLDQATCELAWTNCVKGVRRFSHMWNGMIRDSERGENYHATQKPVSLFLWIMSLPWIPAGAVFDPYAGSAPCGVACVRLGRDYIGCEISPEYHAIATRRLKEAEAADGLFAQSTTSPQSPPAK